MYRVRFLGAASKELAGLDKPVARRIIERFNGWRKTSWVPISKLLQGTFKDYSSCEWVTIESSMKLFMAKA
jgi:hypothetical protein